MTINDYMIPISCDDEQNGIVRKYLFPNGYEVQVIDYTIPCELERYAICVYHNGVEVRDLYKSIDDMRDIDVLLENYAKLPAPDASGEGANGKTVHIKPLNDYNVLQSYGQIDIYELPNKILVETTWSPNDEELEKVRVKTGSIWIEFPAKNSVDLEMLLHLMAKA